MAARIVEHAVVVEHAERWFTQHHDIDMDGLARQLSISRATLYRIVGSRDRLLGDVLWERGRRGMQWARKRSNGSGADFVIDHARHFNAAVVTDEVLRGFIRRDPTAAFRVLFMPEGRVHSRFVLLWREVLQEQVDAGALPATLDVDQVAYLFVRLGESVLYADLLAGRAPDIELAARVQRAVLDAEAATGELPR